MEAGQQTVCRICERSVPGNLMLAHTERCRVVQHCADVVQRSNDSLARIVTKVEVRLRRSGVFDMARGGGGGAAATGSSASMSREPTPLGSRSVSSPLSSSSDSTPPGSQAWSASSTTGPVSVSATSGSAPALANAASSSDGRMPTPLPLRMAPGAAGLPAGLHLEPLLLALASVAQNGLALDRADDLGAEARALCDAVLQLESTLTTEAATAGAAAGQPISGAEQESLRADGRSVIQAIRAKEEALTNIRRCLQQRPEAALTSEYVGLPRLDDFIVHRTLSRGAFGEVLLARKRSTQDYYAIKVMRKRDLVRKNQMNYVLNERILMARMDSPYIIKLFYSFQTVESLYMVLEYANGGDVAKLLRNYGNALSESWARFYAAEIVQALDHIHQLGIVHRDIKPDNLLISANGHIKLADFGLSQDGMDRAHVMPGVEGAIHASRLASAGTTPAAASAGVMSESQRQQLMEYHSADRRRLFSFVGTEDYMAPEVIMGAGHDTAIDWWSFGVCLYEFIAGFPPFYDLDNRPEVVVDNIMRGHIQFPENMSGAGQDLILRLLEPDPSRRLGARGADEVRQHRFFAGIDWANLHRSAASPHIPFINRGSEEDLHDESNRISLAAMAISTTEDGGAEPARPQEHLLTDPELLAQFQFKNVALLADVNLSIAGAILPPSRAALPTASLLEDQMLVPVREPTQVNLPDNRPISCLVAEDNPVTQQVICGLMQQMGARITQAFTGTETVRQANATQFDLIFMDIMMPEMDGSMATLEIRNKPESRNRDTPIIAFTALGDWNEHEYERIGMNDLLAKPFTRAELFAVFTRWLHRRV